MAPNTGNSHSKWIRVWVDDDGVPTLRDISADVTNVTIPINFDSQDVTGYSDGVRHVTIGQPSMVVAMDGVFSNTANTGSHIVLSAIVGKCADNTYTVKIQIGIRKAPEATDPEFLGEFYCTDYVVNGDLTWSATFQPGIGTAPLWGAYT